MLKIFNKKKTINTNLYNLIKNLLVISGILFINKNLYIYTELFINYSMFEYYSNVIFILFILNSIPHLLELFRKKEKLGWFGILCKDFYFSFSINWNALFLLFLSIVILNIIALLKIINIIKIHNIENYFSSILNYESSKSSLTAIKLNLGFFINNVNINIVSKQLKADISYFISIMDRLLCNEIRIKKLEIYPTIVTKNIKTGLLELRTGNSKKIVYYFNSSLDEGIFLAYKWSSKVLNNLYIQNLIIGNNYKYFFYTLPEYKNMTLSTKTLTYTKAYLYNKSGFSLFREGMPFLEYKTLNFENSIFSNNNCLSFKKIMEISNLENSILRDFINIFQFIRYHLYLFLEKNDKNIYKLRYNSFSNNIFWLIQKIKIFLAINDITNGLRTREIYGEGLLKSLSFENGIFSKKVRYTIIKDVHGNYLFTISFMLLFKLLNNWIFIDGVSLWLFWLVLTVSYVISFSNSKKKLINNNILYKKYKIYNNLLNIILLLMVFCFLIKDLFLFFIAFEAILFPLFVYIIFQGSRLNKIFAVKYLVIYTVIGSIFLWYPISYIFEIFGVSNYDQIKWSILNSSSSGTRKILFLSFFLGFAFKVPLVPFHHWLIIAHVEAPTNGSIILAALLLKVGGYGLYRFVYSLFPLESFQFSNEILTLSLIGFTYATVLAVRQIDVKRYIAYTSIAHMNYSIMGLFSCNEYGILGYVHIMISHGIIATAMFYLIGHVYSILHFRDTLRLSGMSYIYPKVSLFIFIFSIANMGLPLFSGFPGEFFIFISLVQVNELFALFIFFGFLFSGVYNFLQINKLLFSSYNLSIFLKKNEDLDSVSILVLSILLFWSIALGLLPDIIFKNV